jgi:hypothetical protein
VIRRFPIDHKRPWIAGTVVRRAIPRVHGTPLVRVLSVREQQLRTVSHKDALNEDFQGKRARVAFQLDWVRRHDKHWCRRHPCASDAQLMERWRARHATRTVHVVTLELIRIDRERFLAHQRPLSGHTTGGNGQYAAVASIDRLPVAALSDDDVREARLAGARVRQERSERQRAEVALVRADRGRLQRRRHAG